MNLKILNSEDFIIFTTRTYALACQIECDHASKQLKRLQEKGVLQNITRGLWANIHHPYFTPLSAVPYLLGGEQGYVSFLTALHRQGILSQIPSVIQIASTGHARRLNSPIGYFEFFQLAPRMMQEGINWSETKLNFPIAIPEKALLDTFYIATRRGRRFGSLPKLELTADVFSKKRFLDLLKQQVPYEKIRRAILTRVERLTQI